MIVPPFYEHLGRRLVKSPKLLIADSGAPMQKLATVLRRRRRGRVSVRLDLVHQAPKAGTATSAVAPGVRASAWQDFVRGL